MKDIAEENRRLRRTMRDLVALSTLPAVWVGLGPEGIARSLADALLHTLSLDLIYVRLAGLPGESDIEVFSSRQGVDVIGLEALRESLVPLAAADRSEVPATVPDPMAAGTLHVAVTRFGVGDDHGVLVAASRNADFPSEPERLLLSVGANQTAIVVQRRRAEEMLRQSNARKSAILDTALDCIISMDHEGKVVEFNPAAERTFGYRREGVLGKTLADLMIPAALRIRHERGLSHYLATGDGPILGKRVELTAMRADGTEFPVELAITRIPTDGPPLFTAYLRDISERANNERHRYIRLSITQSLAQAATVSEAASGFLQAVCEGLGWEMGFFWALDPGTGALRCEGSWRTQEHGASPFETASRKHTFERGEGLPGRAWATGKPTWLLDVAEATDLPRAASAAKEGLHGAFACPLVLGIETLGVVEFFSQRIREPDPDLLETMTTIAGVLGQLVERKQAEEALRASEEKLRLMADTIPQLAWMARPDGHIFWYNRRWHEYTGTTPEEMEGWGWRFVHHPDYLPTVMERWTASLDSGEPFDMVFPLKGADGQFRPFLTRVNPLRDEKGRILYWFGTNTDISEIKRMEEVLRDTDRRKDEFLATLAHELRNPLAPIRNSLQILKMPRIDAATSQRVREMMERQLQHLIRLVDDLLDVSRVMRGRIELRKHPVELATVVARAVEMARPLIDIHAHELEIVHPPDSLLVDADPVRLSQVVANLLTNAAKYTEARGHIRLSAGREGGDAVLRVRDDGIGIAADMLPQVFDLFMQVDHAATRSQGGLGIGLTLVKNLVDLHGGKVEAHSAGLGSGCEVTVRLPLMTQSPAEVNGIEEPQQAIAPSGCRLLVVDDNKDAANSLAMLLRLQGHEVAVSHDGISALETAASFRPALIFLDLGMPRMDGYEVARRIRRSPGLEKTILAALTGWGQKEDRRRTAEAGFDHHFVKPLDPKLLLSLLAGLNRTVVH